MATDFGKSCAAVAVPVSTTRRSRGYNVDAGVTAWKYSHGTFVKVCPTCKRKVKPPRALGKIDLDKGLCRCGQPLNSYAKRRLKNWICTRKEAIYDPDLASRVAREISSDNRGTTIPYLCPFSEPDKPHYHVGQIFK